MAQLASNRSFQSPVSRVVRVGGSAIPTILPSNGTVATNGTITLVTALPGIFPHAWIYLPAGAVVGGAAGMYYVQFSSTTVGRVTRAYETPAVRGFVPYIPAPALAVTHTGSNSAYTQALTSVAVLNFVVPGNLMGSDGEVCLFATGTVPSNANAKNCIASFGAFQFLNTPLASINSFYLRRRVSNRGTPYSQISASLLALGGGDTNTTANVYGSVNTIQDVQVKLELSIAVGTDYVIIEDSDLDATDSI
jgi:hypothetical protein